MGKMKTMLKNINRRSFKYNSISAIFIVSAIAVVIVINLIVNSLVSNNVLPLKWDLSANKIYSISEQTIDLLKSVNKDVNIYALYDRSEVVKSATLIQVKEVLDQYAKYSSHIKITYVDPDKNPGFVSGLGVADNSDLMTGNFLIKSGNKTRILTGDDITEAVYDETTGEQSDQIFIGEQSFTGAIKYMLSDNTPVVYLTEGNGEPKLDEAYTDLRKQLQANNYDVRSINLILAKKTPADADVLMIGSPTTDITKNENILISEYLDNGGKAIFLIDSLSTKKKLPNFENLLATYNIGIEYDKVKDSSNYYGDYQYLIGLKGQSNEIINEPFEVMMADSRSLRILSNENSNLVVTSLIKTTDKAVGVQIDKSSGNNLKGPLDIAIAVENKGGTKPSKIFVVGNGSFITDAAQTLYGANYQYGKDFFTETLNWMIGSTDTTVIGSKSYLPQPLTISNAQSSVILVVVLIVLPLLVFSAGLFVWLRRRHL